MSSSSIITIFSSPPPSRTKPGFVMFSVVAHSLVLGFGILAINDAPRIEDRSVTPPYTTRIVKLQGLQPQLQWSPESGAAHSSTQSRPETIQSGGRPAAAAAPQSLAYHVAAPTTLVQPDIAQNKLPLLKAAIPLVVMWTPPEMPVKNIIPRPSQTAASVSARPSLAMPNHEVNVANVQLSSSSFVSATVPIVASTTSPIRVPGLQVAQVPTTASKPSETPTPATVLSVSDVLPSEGIIVLPPVNQTAAASISDSFAPGRPTGPAKSGDQANPENQNGNGPGAGSGSASGQRAAATGTGGASEVHGENNGSEPGSDEGSSSIGGNSVVRMTRPKDGNYGVVVVGASMTEQYPETLGMWGDRLAYTVYLQVGAEKNWIMQYCLPRVQQAAGGISRPDAPWPYLIAVPHLGSDPDTDALLVHGFINTAGHFEHLAVVFPAQFPQSKFILSALQQWQFRPAAQNGKSTTVEVLLIIPEEAE
ncbi:MAG TPA: hypothetical protein VFN62_04815 [Acidobacteriaceae bacterium]|nr:hypothetical protein [Acidobacteriaceae bacterium]